MNFRNIIAIVAIIGLTTQAHAADVLRRSEEIAPTPAVTPVAPTAAATEVKVVETKAVEVKTVEAKPVEIKAIESKAIETPVETKAASKADELRKARVSEEVKTESTIVEKLEGERLSEEQKRAERLFSDKASKTEVAPAPVVAPAPTVNIEKIEINQPTQVRAEAPVVVAPVVAPAPVKTEAAPGAVDAAAGSVYRFYVGGMLAAPEYNDSKVNTNFGLGGTVGVMIDEDYAVEGSFIYSNFNVTNPRNQFSAYQTNGSNRRDLDQYEVKATFKWFALRSLLGTSRLKPYIGGSGSYIYREYSRSNSSSNSYYDPSYGSYGQSGSNSSQTSDAFNLGAVVGADFEVTKNFAIGAFFEYSTPIMSSNVNSNNNGSNGYNAYGVYNTNANQTRVDSWDLYTFGLAVKFLF